MGGVYATIKFIKSLSFDKFVIPDYQRPYVWEINQVRQLWDDLIKSCEERRQDYRIGTVIFHKNGSSLDIVDGQQRVTTLSIILLLLACDLQDSSISQYLNCKQFQHVESIKNIIRNGHEIKEWMAEDVKNDIFAHYILNHCSLVVVEVDNIAEAFQVFDSQNGRGLKLEAYNLLKAYHMRAFEANDYNSIPQERKVLYDRNWEQAAKGGQHISDYLKQVVEEHLFRIRVWSRKEDVFTFTKQHIDEFKGVTIGKSLYPHENIANWYVGRAQAVVEVERTSLPGIKSDVHIYQPIINGAMFFDYIDNYVRTYQLLFENQSFVDLEAFRVFFAEYCTGFTKVGDSYLLNLYKSMVMLVFDMYGSSGVVKYYLIIYAYVFRLRLEKKFVKYNTVSKYPTLTMSKIKNSKRLSDLSFIRALALTPITQPSTNGNNAIVELFFQNYFKDVEIKQS